MPHVPSRCRRYTNTSTSRLGSIRHFARCASIASHRIASHRIASHRIAQPPRACVACASTRFGSQYRFGVLNRLSPVRVGGYCIRYDSVPKLRRITIGFAEGLMRVCV